MPIPADFRGKVAPITLVLVPQNVSDQLEFVRNSFNPATGVYSATALNAVIEIDNLRYVMPSPRTIIYLDFTPDERPGPNDSTDLEAGSFLETFRDAEDSDDTFLDYDRDHDVDRFDASAAARRIRQRVASLFAPFKKQGLDIRIRSNSGRLEGGEDDGDHLLDNHRGKDDSDFYLVYVGGSNAGADGLAFQAPVGTNNEHYAYVFTDNLVENFRDDNEFLTFFNRGIKAADFTNHVAHMIAHEVGHLMGLGDVTVLDDDIPAPEIQSVMQAGGDSNAVAFHNAAYTARIVERTQAGTDDGYVAWQNPYTEIRRSTRSTEMVLQPTVRYNSEPAEHADDYDTVLFDDSEPAPRRRLGSAPWETRRLPKSRRRWPAASIPSAEYVTRFTGDLNRSADAIPLMSPEVATLFNLGLRFQNLITPLDLAGVTTMTQLQTRLQTAGYTIEGIQSDLASLPSNQPADLRARFPHLRPVPAQQVDRTDAGWRRRPARPGGTRAYERPDAAGQRAD